MTHLVQLFRSWRHASRHTASRRILILYHSAFPMRVNHRSNLLRIVSIGDKSVTGVHIGIILLLVLGNVIHNPAYPPVDSLCCRTVETLIVRSQVEPVKLQILSSGLSSRVCRTVLLTLDHCGFKVF